MTVAGLLFAIAPVMSGHTDLAAAQNAVPGLRPTTVTLQQVLNDYKKALGTSQPPITSEIEQGTINEYGLGGTFYDITRGDDYRDIETLGGITTQTGRLQGQRWRQNENGVTLLVRGVHHRSETSWQSLRAAANESSPDVRLIGEVEQPTEAYVVEVHPAAGRRMWIFYGKKSHLIERTQASYPDGNVTVTYSDFHDVNGVKKAWHVHTTDGYAPNDEDDVTTSDQVNTIIADDMLKMPSVSRNPVEFPAGKNVVQLPARIVDGHIIIRVTVNGRGLDFALDSGADGIVFDSAISRQLGLQMRGESMQTDAGTYEQSEAVVPEMSVGDLKMHNIIVDSVPLQWRQDEKTKMVGLLGFDFFAGAVLKIDYEHGTVAAIQPDAFSPPPTAVQVDATIDDGVPLVAARVNEALGEHFVVDTGSPATVVFSGFANSHSRDVIDASGGALEHKFLTDVDWQNLTADEQEQLEGSGVYGEGVGGELHMRLIQLASFITGGVNFNGEGVLLTKDASAFEGEDLDGLIGYDILNWFTLYFDYFNSRIVFEPNDQLKRRMSAPLSPTQPKVRR